MLNRDCREDEGEQSTPLLQLPPLWAYWCAFLRCHVGGLVLSSCLAESFELVVLTSLLPAHIAVNLLWHLCPRITLTRFLTVLEDNNHDFTRRSPGPELFPAWRRLMIQFHWIFSSVVRNYERRFHHRLLFSTDKHVSRSYCTGELPHICFLGAVLCSIVNIIDAHIPQTFL